MMCQGSSQVTHGQVGSGQSGARASVGRLVGREGDRMLTPCFPMMAPTLRCGNLLASPAHTTPTQHRHHRHHRHIDTTDTTHDKTARSAHSETTQKQKPRTQNRTACQQLPCALAQHSHCSCLLYTSPSPRDRG
eukprot:3447558-Rhodomonas_salina.1